MVTDNKYEISYDKLLKGDISINYDDLKDNEKASYKRAMRRQLRNDGANKQEINEMLNNEAICRAFYGTEIYAATFGMDALSKLLSSDEVDISDDGFVDFISSQVGEKVTNDSFDKKVKDDYDYKSLTALPVQVKKKLLADGHFEVIKAKENEGGFDANEISYLNNPLLEKDFTQKTLASVAKAAINWGVYMKQKAQNIFTDDKVKHDKDESAQLKQDRVVNRNQVIQRAYESVQRDLFEPYIEQAKVENEEIDTQYIRENVDRYKYKSNDQVWSKVIDTFADIQESSNDTESSFNLGGFTQFLLDKENKSVSPVYKVSNRDLQNVFKAADKLRERGVGEATIASLIDAQLREKIQQTEGAGEHIAKWASTVFSGMEAGILELGAMATSMAEACGIMENNDAQAHKYLSQKKANRELGINDPKEDNMDKGSLSVHLLDKAEKARQYGFVSGEELERAERNGMSAMQMTEADGEISQFVGGLITSISEMIPTTIATSGAGSVLAKTASGATKVAGAVAPKAMKATAYINKAAAWAGQVYTDAMLTTKQETGSVFDDAVSNIIGLKREAAENEIQRRITEYSENNLDSDTQALFEELRSNSKYSKYSDDALWRMAKEQCLQAVSDDIKNQVLGSDAYKDMGKVTDDEIANIDSALRTEFYGQLAKSALFSPFLGHIFQPTLKGFWKKSDGTLNKLGKLGRNLTSEAIVGGFDEGLDDVMSTIAGEYAKAKQYEYEYDATKDEYIANQSVLASMAGTVALGHSLDKFMYSTEGWQSFLAGAVMPFAMRIGRKKFGLDDFSYDKMMNSPTFNGTGGSSKGKTNDGDNTVSGTTTRDLQSRSALLYTAFSGKKSNATKAQNTQDNPIVPQQNDGGDSGDAANSNNLAALEEAQAYADAQANGQDQQPTPDANQSDVTPEQPVIPESIKGQQMLYQKLAQFSVAKQTLDSSPFATAKVIDSMYTLMNNPETASYVRQAAEVNPLMKEALALHEQHKNLVSEAIRGVAADGNVTNIARGYISDIASKVVSGHSFMIDKGITDGFAIISGVDMSNSNGRNVPIMVSMEDAINQWDSYNDIQKGGYYSSLPKEKQKELEEKLQSKASNIEDCVVAYEMYQTAKQNKDMLDAIKNGRIEPVVLNNAAKAFNDASNVASDLISYKKNINKFIKDTVDKHIETGKNDDGYSTGQLSDILQELLSNDVVSRDKKMTETIREKMKELNADPATKRQLNKGKNDNDIDKALPASQPEEVQQGKGVVISNQPVRGVPELSPEDVAAADQFSAEPTPQQLGDASGLAVEEASQQIPTDNTTNNTTYSRDDFSNTETEYYKNNDVKKIGHKYKNDPSKINSRTFQANALKKAKEMYGYDYHASQKVLGLFRGNIPCFHTIINLADNKNAMSKMAAIVTLVDIKALPVEVQNKIRNEVPQGNIINDQVCIDVSYTQHLMQKPGIPILCSISVNEDNDGAVGSLDINESSGLVSIKNAIKNSIVFKKQKELEENNGKTDDEIINSIIDGLPVVLYKKSGEINRLTNGAKGIDSNDIINNFKGSNTKKGGVYLLIPDASGKKYFAALLMKPKSIKAESVVDVESVDKVDIISIMKSNDCSVGNIQSFDIVNVTYDESGNISNGEAEMVDFGMQNTNATAELKAQSPAELGAENPQSQTTDELYNQAQVDQPKAPEVQKKKYTASKRVIKKGGGVEENASREDTENVNKALSSPENSQPINQDKIEGCNSVDVNQ